MEPVSFCEVCGNPEESISHVLLECTVAKQFWHQAKVASGVRIRHLNAADTWAAVRALSEEGSGCYHVWNVDFVNNAEQAASWRIVDDGSAGCDLGEGHGL